tara:strand:+ start:872 stop:1645 length:774 start_codon:yes stop_codon:yes gene_type:complete
MNKVKNFWDSQAQEYRDNYQATNPDFYSFVKEIEILKEYLKENLEVLEYGCGNGYASRQLFKETAYRDYLGIDYSTEMIASARIAYEAERSTTDFCTTSVKYEVGNVKTHQPSKKFDVVVTDRCLINLETHEEQMEAVKNIHSNLKAKGCYLMIECSKKSLANINEIRTQYGLDQIAERWHNCYLEEDRFLKEIHPYFSVEKIDCFASTYFLISRTINALADSGPINYLSRINELASQLPALGDYAPLKLFVLKKRG